MSSSGLIYAMIVGAWAAYLVPMWLRRQDELNEARPTERFSTAIRLLTGRGNAERRAARAGDREPDGSAPDGAAEDGGEHPPHASADSAAMEPDGAPDALARGRDCDVRSAAVPASPPRGPGRSERRPAAPRTGKGPGAHPAAPADRRARAKVLARRRRTTTLLFVALTAGAIAAAAGGLRLLWAAAVPAVLLAAYIAHVRSQERRRYRYAADPRHAEAAAQRVRERAAARARQAPAAEPEPSAADVPTQVHDPASDEPPAAPPEAGYAADRRALVEQTDHAEWVDDQERERARSRPDDSGWEPVPVPLPTYVTAPVAPRATDGLDLGAPDTWSSARSSTGDGRAGPAADARPAGDPRPDADARLADARPADAGPAADEPARPEGSAAEPARPRRSRERGRTPLFDQYANPDRPRAANE